MRQGGSWEDGIWPLRYVPAVSASTFHFRDLDTMGRRKAWGSQYTFTARQTRSSAVSGRGIYPVRRPVYDTAFVFMEQDFLDVDVPPWAIKIILSPEDLGRDVEEKG